MTYLTKSHTMNESAEFYIKHSQKIKKAIETQAAAYNYVVEAVLRVAEHFGWTAFGNTSYWRNLWDENKRETVYITAYPETIADENGKVLLILEIYNAAIPYEQELRKLIPSKMTHENWKSGSKMHLASMNYQVQLEDFPKLSEKIISFIETDFSPVKEKMLEFLKAKDAHQHK